MATNYLRLITTVPGEWIRLLKTQSHTVVVVDDDDGAIGALAE